MDQLGRFFDPQWRKRPTEALLGERSKEKERERQRRKDKQGAKVQDDIKSIHPSKSYVQSPSAILYHRDTLHSRNEAGRFSMLFMRAHYRRLCCLIRDFADNRKLQLQGRSCPSAIGHAQSYD